MWAPHRGVPAVPSVIWGGFLEKPECWTPVTSTLKCLRATGLAQFTQLWHSAFWEQTCLEEWVQ